jgi:thiamine kinase-like enzyme
MGQSVLCHHNLVPGNIIEDDEGVLKVLGWKFAGAGSSVIDAVGLGRSWQNSELTTRLMDAENTEAHPVVQQIIDFYELVLPLRH